MHEGIDSVEAHVTEASVSCTYVIRVGTRSPLPCSLQLLLPSIDSLSILCALLPDHTRLFSRDRTTQNHRARWGKKKSRSMKTFSSYHPTHLTRSCPSSTHTHTSSPPLLRTSINGPPDHTRQSSTLYVGSTAATRRRCAALWMCGARHPCGACGGRSPTLR